MTTGSTGPGRILFGSSGSGGFVEGAEGRFQGDPDKAEWKAFSDWAMEEVGSVWRIPFPGFRDNLIYKRWVSSGKPVTGQPIAQLGQGTLDVLADNPILAEAVAASGANFPPEQDEVDAARAGIVSAGRQQAASNLVTEPDGERPGPTFLDDVDQSQFALPTEILPPGQEYIWNPSIGAYEPQRIPRAPLAPLPQPAQAPFRFDTPTVEDPFGGQGRWNPNTGRWEAGPDFISPGQQAQTEAQTAATALAQSRFEFDERTALAAQELQQQQLTGQREERLAQLAAQPAQWLQHAALSGVAPVVQKWMEALQRPGQNLEVGQNIPGVQGFGQSGGQGGSPQGQQGGFLPGTAVPGQVDFSGLPSLRNPSAQLFARFGPTAQQQFAGFRQARTGIPPDELFFRLGQAGAPRGTSSGAFQQARLRV